jgi:hypothetical protein
VKTSRGRAQTAAELRNNAALRVSVPARLRGVKDLGNMFQFKRDFEEYICGARNLDAARALNSALASFDTWLTENQSRIPLE